MQTISLQTPVGTLWISEENQALCQVAFHEPVNVRYQSTPLLTQAAQQLTEYFDGRRTHFKLPLTLTHGTPFQQQVWQQLLTIPYGELWHYQQLAEAINNPQAVRAVGQANRRNPLPIVVPCHRVIGKNGQLTGYMGTQGLAIKAHLLQLEGISLENLTHSH